MCACARLCACVHVTQFLWIRIRIRKENLFFCTGTVPVRIFSLIRNLLPLSINKNYFCLKI